jgi:2-[(L-alanin-3-ylcarbamoyl)methyl]-2-hydroxybutanedioate decarboxylase
MLPDRVRDALLAADRPVCAYVYDRAVLRARASSVKAALPRGSELLYAVKANGHPEIVRTLAEECDGLEVASGGELALAVEALSGPPGSRLTTSRSRLTAPGFRLIAFGGPAKTDAELRAAAAPSSVIRASPTSLELRGGRPDHGVVVHVESVLELRRLSAVADSGAVDAPVAVALRVNRDGGGLDGSHRMTGEPTPFGIDEAALPEAVALATALPGIRLIGFHLHAVSNNLDAAAHAAFVDGAVRWSVAAAARLRVPLEYVNVGGGFGVSYTGGASFDVTALSGVDVPPGVRLVFEPGRYLAADAGWYAAEVLDLKRTHGRWFAVLRGGTHHFRLPAAWGYSHPFTVLPVPHWPYPFERPWVAGVAVDAVGELCTPRDVLTRGQRVDRLRVGDVLVFGRAGAYGWDISHHDFLRHQHPQVFVL